MQRTHVVQAVRELDQQHADVLRHGEHQLAEVLRLLALVGLQLELAELGYAVDQPRNVGPEVALDIVEGCDRVLDRIMKKTGDDRSRIELFRSEEHTSELQSLMRISYAVFCLKKKKKQ